MRASSAAAVAGFFLLTGSVAHASGKDVEDLLAHMRSAYAAVKSATFTTESHFGPTVFVNSFSVKGQSKIRLDITAPDAKDFKSSLIKISDGTTIYFKLPGTTDYTNQTFSVDAFEQNLPANLESFCFFDSERQLSTAPGKNMEHSSLKLLPNEDWNGKKWTVLEETATEQKVVCRYFVDLKTFFIWRTVVRPIGVDGDAEDSQVTKMDTAAKVADSVFAAPH